MQTELISSIDPMPSIHTGSTSRETSNCMVRPNYYYCSPQYMPAKHVHTTICTVFLKEQLVLKHLSYLIGVLCVGYVNVSVSDTDKDLHDVSVCLRVLWVNVLLAFLICLAYEGFIKFLISSPSWSTGIHMH